MKKFLSLVLALVMTMSLVTVSAGAVDFTDDSDIDYKEAVDVISALGIVDGYSDDSFRPDGSLTRGAAAKIICNLILGPTTASALSATTAPFKDVPTTNTFAGYITYCAQQGIIGGYGDGTFRPSGTLTGNAFMKMLLGALGYDSSIEGYSGANWQVNVIKQAVGIGLKDGNDEFVGSKAVTRQEAALYAFNMIQANLVQYDSKTTVNVNGATVTVAGDKAENIPQDGSGYDNTMNDSENVVQFAEKHFPRLTRTNDGVDDMGRPATEWKYRTDIIGKYADDSDLKGTWTSKVSKDELYDLVGGSIVSELTETRPEADLSVWVNGENVIKFSDTVTDAQVATYFVRNASGAIGTDTNGTGQAGNGVITEVYMDDDNNITIVMANTYLLRATADYNEARESVSVETVVLNDGMPALPAVIDQEDFNVSDVKEGDYLIVTWSDTADDIQTVEKADILTGSVSEYTERDSVTIDGTKYSYNKLLEDDLKSEEFSINSDATVVMDPYGYIIFVDEAVANSSYVYIEQFGSTSSLSITALAKAYFTDGTTDEIEVNKVDGEDSQRVIAGYEGAAYEKWYTFTENKDGSYNLMSTRAPRRAYEDSWNTAIVDPNGEDIVLNDKVQFLDNMDDTSVYGDEDTIFVLVDAEDTVKTYVGVANAPTVTLAAGVDAGKAKVAWVEDESGYAKFVFIDLNGLSDSEVSVDDSTEDTVIFVLKDNNKRTVVEGTEYYQYTVVDTDGTINTAKYFDSYMDCETGYLYTNIRTNSDGYVTGGNIVGKEGTASDQAYYWMDGDSTVEQSGRTMKFVGMGNDSDGDGDGASANFVIPSDANVNLVIGKGVTELLKDDDADYESYLNTTPGTVGGMLSGYRLKGAIYAIMDDNTTDVVTTLYVYVTDAEQITTNLIPTVTADAANDYSYAAGENAKQLKFTITAPAGTMTYSVTKPDGTTTASAAVPTGGTIQFYPTADLASGTVVAGDYTITVVNTKDGVTETKSFTYTVTDDDEAAVTGVTIKSVPTITSGTAVNLDSVVLELTYSVGSPKTVTAGSVNATFTADGQALKNGDSLLYADYDSGKFDLVATVDGESSAAYEVTITSRPGKVTMSTAKLVVAANTESTNYVTLSVDEGAEIQSVTPTGTGVSATLNDTKDVVTITTDSNYDGTSCKVTINWKDEAGTDKTSEITIATA